MKSIPKAAICLIIVLSASGMFVCAQNPCGPPGNVIVAAEPKKKSLEGEVISFFSNGNIKSKLFYISNNLHGTQFYFHMNGKPHSKTTYLHGMLEGPFQEYYDNGNLQMEGTFHYNKKEGSFINYTQQGIKLIEGKYAAGNINEQYKYFYENGQLAYSLLYKHGKLIQDGETNIYYPDGKIKRIEMYKAGERKGNWRSYYPSGKLLEEAVNNKKNGAGSLIEYHTNGNVKSIVHFYLDPNISSPLTDNILLQGAK
nr:toxin-antitoxin system YwqK family antitoxin [Bacteroidota bacterium]